MKNTVPTAAAFAGMFAFAIWDKKHRRLFAARDRVGIKPLYYCQTTDALYFASELKAIITDPAVSRENSLPALRQFFSFFYLPGEDTLFKSVRRLLPGHYSWQRTEGSPSAATGTCISPTSGGDNLSRKRSKNSTGCWPPPSATI